ncbi:MAG: branched-chain amino acid ABC transporter permease [Actinomycetota bacterium]|nr:branched-chain amino acid ABC transporter permease [Actinomycetota bacterium]
MNKWLAGVFVLVTLALPPLLPERHLATYVLLGLTATVTVGVSLLMGYAGQVPLGQAAFYAIGAYGAGLLAVHGFPSLLGLLVAPLIAAVAAVLLGAPLLRLRGHHLAFATLAVQLILLSLLSQGTWAGGAIGLQGIPRLSVAGFELREDVGYAYVAWGVLAVALLVSRNVVRSRSGRALRAAATSETAAAASGVPVGAYRLAVFALSAGFAGLAGGVYAFYLGYLSPGSFPVLLSIEFVVMAVVGGLGTLSGPLVGAIVIVLLVQALNTLGTQPGMPSYAPSVLSYAVYALLLVVAVRYLPGGLVPAAQRLTRRLFPALLTGPATDGGPGGAVTDGGPGGAVTDGGPGGPVTDGGPGGPVTDGGPGGPATGSGPTASRPRSAGEEPGRTGGPLPFGGGKGRDRADSGDRPVMSRTGASESARVTRTDVPGTETTGPSAEQEE